ncbi:DUF354 domain-containing protein [Thermoproteota archaeon]
MKILIDIKHPAHVHFFKNFIKIMEGRGHKILVTSREKDLTIHLLDKYGIANVCISSIGKNKIELAKELFIRNKRFLKIAAEFMPDVLLGIMGITVAPTGRILGIASIVFYDTEIASLTNFIAYTLCDKFITPNCYRERLGRKNIRYNGYQELSYLHPNYFSPDPGVLKELGLERNEKYVVMRFVSWRSSHDFDRKGINIDTILYTVKKFQKFGKIFITSERDLPGILEKYRLHLAPEKIHSLIYYATLLYGESATMASEAAILGTYAIYLDDIGRGYTDEEEQKYNLVFNYSTQKKHKLESMQKGIELLRDEDSKKEAQHKRERLLTDKIDVTNFMIEEVLKFKK